MTIDVVIVERWMDGFRCLSIYHSEDMCLVELLLYTCSHLAGDDDGDLDENNCC
jgi:hypothetical protein